ncbi:MAG: hypothetical protein RL681_429 [Candidatus Parcubacteria bacterium]|jgi:membrane-associated phospholipid phosphatase
MLFFFGFLIAIMVVQHRLPRVIRWIIGGISFLLIATVSISRVYLGVHWLMDFIGCYLVGFILLSGYLYFYFKNFRPEGRPGGAS